MSKYIPLTEQLRQAILNCGQTRYAICKATGIGQDVLSRFIHGERGLSMEVLDTLGEYLGLRIVTDIHVVVGTERSKNEPIRVSVTMIEKPKVKPVRVSVTTEKPRKSKGR